MFSAIYVESEVGNWPRVREIIARNPGIPIIDCERYGEVFNRNAQNFRLQKSLPALIVARKFGNLVLPTPSGYGFNEYPSYYFSHMLNCVYDCRYCFLQGMYRSANYVLFVNYEEFGEELTKVISSSQGPCVFYSGYDCDSLALEPVSKFCEFYLPFFAKYPDAMLEIRTKSTQIRNLLERQPIENVIIAMSFTDEISAAAMEHKVPAIDKRLEALRKLQQAGWRVALRFEPMVPNETMVAGYRRLFAQLFSVLDARHIHSVSTGAFRMPVDFFKNIVRLYPDEPLFARETQVKDGLIAISHSREAEQLMEIEQELLRHISADQYYRCAS